MRFLHTLFGNYWFVKVVFLLALAFWPIWAYWDQIAFDPAQFTSEWIKTFAAGVILWIVLLFLKGRFDDSSQGLQSMIRLAEIRALLNELKCSFVVNDSGRIGQLLDTIGLHLEKTDSTQYPATEHNRRLHLRQCLFDDRATALFQAYCGDAISESEKDELLMVIDNSMNGFEGR